MIKTQQELNFLFEGTTTAQLVPIEAIAILRKMHKAGILGGETMPEDANPGLVTTSEENAIFFTLPMALNYQRNSYALWPAAKLAYLDKETSFIFNPKEVLNRSEHEVRTALTKYKVALQPNRHVQIWIKVCEGLCRVSDGKVRSLFEMCDFDVPSIKRLIQIEHKALFPYLSGEKILNYWLYVMEQYAGVNLKSRDAISVAPDTHVLQASVQLGILTQTEAASPLARGLAAERWASLLKGTDLVPIDIHTPLWLWSRKGFPRLNL